MHGKEGKKNMRKTGGENEVKRPQDKEHLELQETERDKEVFSPRSFRGTWLCLHIGMRHLQETIFLFSAPHFVVLCKSATGNVYRCIHI